MNHFSPPLDDLTGLSGDPAAERGLAGSSGLTIVKRSWNELDCPDRIAAWDALAQWASEPNPFYESWFLLPSLRAFDPRGEVILLTLETGGQLAGILPLRRETSYYGYPLPHWRSWVHPNCFCGMPLVARGMEHAFWREALAWCDQHAGTALFLHLAQLPASGPVATALRDVLTGQQRAGATVHSEERALLHSPLGAEEYLEQSLSTKKRKELRRQRRRLEDEGALAVERSGDADNIVDWTRDFLKLESKGWKGAAGSALASSEPTERLFAEALEGAAHRGRLERLTLRLDGEPIAMLASFVAAPGAFSFKTAFDENFSRFSPGVLLQIENLAFLGRKDVHWVDSCAAEDHPMIDHIWRERKRIVRHSIALGGAPRRAIFRLIARGETGSWRRSLT